jgi:hypothetical protein
MGPMLFSGGMVNAIRARIKTQTRRLVVPPRRTARDAAGKACGRMLYDLERASVDEGFPTDDSGRVLPMERWRGGTDPAPLEMYRNHYLKVPVAHPFDGWDSGGEDARERVFGRFGAGDRIWVKESFRVPRVRGKPRPELVQYRADHAIPEECRWTPSIHMPRWASRIMLEVVRRRVERVQAISVEDVKAEGVRLLGHPDGGTLIPIDVLELVPDGAIERGTLRILDDAAVVRAHYAALWESINGRGSWKANPLVWVYELKVVEGGTGETRGTGGAGRNKKRGGA